MYIIDDTFLGVPYGTGSIVPRVYQNVRDKSGELMQMDNPERYYQIYSGTLGTYYGSRFNRNHNLNRPQNVVQLQAGRGPYHNSYDQYCSDIKLIGMGCSIIAEYRISPKLDSYYTSMTTMFDDSFNKLELDGTEIEDVSFAIDTASAFIEQRVHSDYIDLMPYVSEEAKDLKLKNIKLKVKGIKKLLAYDQFYPQTRMLRLANEFHNSYYDNFTLEGSQTTFRTALSPFYSPGIAFNSIKAGVGMPYCVASFDATKVEEATGESNFYILATSSYNTSSILYHKLPWNTILNPYINLERIPEDSNGAKIIRDLDPDIQVDSEAILSGRNANGSAYDVMANNFYSEVVNFFKQDGSLTKIKSKPISEWEFPDLTKKYSMDIIIYKSSDFTTHTSYEGYGPRPYVYHCPPWHQISQTDATGSSYNSDEQLPPSNDYPLSSARVRIVFDPTLMMGNNTDYLTKGKFTPSDILRFSTIEYITQENAPDNAVQISDIVNLFTTSADGVYWEPTLNWECPTADLNFASLQAKLTNSSGYDNGGTVVGDAIRGIWHQYAPISDDNKGLFLSVSQHADDAALTGSLMDVVGFEQRNSQKIGRIADSKNISEALVVIPFYTDECGNEKFFEFEIRDFEHQYENARGLVQEIANISRKYVLPPQLDFVRARDKSDKPLLKEEYGLVKSPFLMFPFEFESVLDRQDLADIWQGVMPKISMTAEIDEKEKQFFIGDILSQFNNKLPENTRFKVFKVKKRAITNYRQVTEKTRGSDFEDLSYGYNWPYDFCSLVEMAEVRAELVYEKE